MLHYSDKNIDVQARALGFKSIRNNFYKQYLDENISLEFVVN